MTQRKLKRPPLRYPMIPVYEILKKTAQRLPQKLAVIDPLAGRELTFADIDRESDTLAGIFFNWQIKKGDRLAFFLQNGWEYFVGFYAAMKVGAIVSTMNPTYREREVKHQVQDAGSKILLTQPDLFPLVKRIFPELTTLEKIIVTRGAEKKETEVFALTELFEKSPSWTPFSPPPNQPPSRPGSPALFLRHGGPEQRSNDHPFQPGGQCPAVYARCRGPGERHLHQLSSL